LFLSVSLLVLGMFFPRSESWPRFGAVPGKMELTTLMTRIMFPFLILVSLAALAMGVLNTRGKFFVPSLASSFFNLGAVVVGVSLSLAAPGSVAPIVGMAWGTWWGLCNCWSSCRCCGGWGSDSSGSFSSGNRDCCGSSS
jgi:peptidoglycan biosynthesis protein MviN/MurJ (putative lipid II flippase)